MLAVNAPSASTAGSAAEGGSGNKRKRGRGAAAADLTLANAVMKSLLVDGFDAEQVWNQLSLRHSALLVDIRRKLATEVSIAHPIDVMCAGVVATLTERLGVPSLLLLRRRPSGRLQLTVPLRMRTPRATTTTHR